MKVIIYLLTTILLYSCSSLDKRAMFTVNPTTIESKATYMNFTVKADPAYPIDSKSAEKTRMKWIQESIIENGYSKEFEITSRTSVVNSTTPLSKIYNIFYKVKVHKP